MEISTSSNIVTITGNIKSVNDFQKIKTSLDSLLREQTSVTINVVDSFSITSSIIGYFNKLILKDKVDLHMKIGDSKLFEPLNDLNLTTVFKASKA